jgi:hypothetical protein
MTQIGMEDSSSDWCFSVWGRPCSPICGSSRATSLDGWPRGESSRRCWWQSSLGIMVFPGLAAFVIPVYFAPIFIFEVTLGLWLLVKGIRAPIVE